MRRTWIFGIICTLLIIFLVGYNIQLQRKIALHEADSNLSSQLNSVEMDLKRAFFSLDQVFIGLKNYLDSYAEQGVADIPQVRRVIDDLVLKNNYLTALMVIDADGQVLHWNNNLQKPNFTQREYFRVHAAGRHDGLYIGQPQESLLNKNQWIFGISKALRKADGSLDKVLAAIIDVKYFYRQYRELLSQPGDTLTITSPEGAVYTHIPDHDRYVGKNLTLPEASKVDGLNKKRTNDGQMLLSGLRKLKNYPLVVSIGKPEEKILASWHASALSFGLISGLASFALLFLTYRAAAYQKKEEEIKATLQRQAITDPLTNLANRRHILEEAQREIKKAQRSKMPLSLSLLDLDHFKKVNDDYGHQAGDEILTGVAELLRANCRESDVISRFGGEEFLLLFPATDLEGAIIGATKIRAALEEKTFKIAAGEVHITASLGVTQWGNDETDINGALRRADKALYQVKKSGRNGVKSLPSNLKDEKQSHSIWLDQRLK